jgi:hypothetical protein
MIFLAYSISLTENINRITKPNRKIRALLSFFREAKNRIAVAYRNMDTVNNWYILSVFEKTFTGDIITSAQTAAPNPVESLLIILENLSGKRALKYCIKTGTAE